MDILELKDLYDIDIADDNTFKGGIEDLGNFREGFCILLKGSNKTGKFKWVLCADSFNAKFQLIKRLVVLRIRCQCIHFNYLYSKIRNIEKQFSLFK